MSDERLVHDVLDSAESILAAALGSAVGMIEAVAGDKAVPITRAIVDDYLAYASRKPRKKSLQ